MGQAACVRERGFDLLIASANIYQLRFMNLKLRLLPFLHKIILMINFSGERHRLIMKHEIYDYFSICNVMKTTN